jgi:hypothetical protein
MRESLVGGIEIIMRGLLTQESDEEPDKELK